MQHVVFAESNGLTSSSDDQNIDDIQGGGPDIVSGFSLQIAGIDGHEQRMLSLR